MPNLQDKLQIVKKEHRLPDLWRGNNYLAFTESRPESYWKYRSQWVDVPKRFEVLDFPLHIGIATNDSCNLRCPMCRRSITRSPLPRYKTGITLSTYSTIIDECSEKGLAALKVSGDNEPLLTKNLPEYVACAKSKGIIDVMINSNATLLTREMGRLLIGAGLDKLNISIDSHIKEDYEASRVGAKFIEVLENVSAFFHLRKEMNSVTPLIRISRVTKHSDTSQLADFTEYWKPFCDEVAFAECGNFSASGKWFDQQGIGQEEAVKKVGLCPQPWQRLEIDYGGKVFPCCSGQESLYIGNALNQSIEEIWKSDKIECLRNAIKKDRVFYINGCRQCYAAQYFTV